MLLLYIGFPIGWFFNLFVTGTSARHMFQIVLGFLMQVFMFRSQFYHTLLMTLVVYLMMGSMSRKTSYRYIFVFSIAYLSCSHIYRMVTNFGGYDMDITTYTMILTTKLSALGFCYKDGDMKNEDLLDEQVPKKIEKLPSVVEILSYVYFTGGCIVGPFFEYSDYKNFIEKKDHYSKVPSTILPSLVYLVKANSKQFVFDLG